MAAASAEAYPVAEATPGGEASTNFMRLYTACRTKLLDDGWFSVPEPVDGQAQRMAALLDAVQVLVNAFAAERKEQTTPKSLAQTKADLFVQQLKADVEKEASLTQAAVRLWTSGVQAADGPVVAPQWTIESPRRLWMAKDRQVRLRAIVGQTLQEDKPGPALEAAVRLVAAFDGLTTYPRQAAAWPWDSLPWDAMNRNYHCRRDTVFRATAMPAAALAFFEEGKEYRTRTHLATCFREEDTQPFMERSLAEDIMHEAVLFVISLDPEQRCDANLLVMGSDAAEAGGAVASGPDGERTLELVFPPHSVFTVVEVEKHVESIPLTVVRRASSSWLNPNVVMLRAAPRQGPPEDLELPLWH